MPSPVRISVKREVIKWARERSGIPSEELQNKFPRLSDWEGERVFPTLRQLEQFAKATLTPIGYLFLSSPPEEIFPIPLFRSQRRQVPTQPSPELRATVFAMQRRQDWMREFLLREGEAALPFVGKFDADSDPVAVAQDIRDSLGIHSDWAQQFSTWEDALRQLTLTVDRNGILIMRNGVVGNNTHRRLDVDEFRGFVLVDQFAPLIFVNGRDFKGAQMFTIAHELAHIWLGIGGAFNLRRLEPFDNDQERFCDKVAAEFLVPAGELKSIWRDYVATRTRFELLARRFKVSPVVVARRALDLDFVSRTEYFAFYNRYRTEQEARIEDQRRRAEADGGKSTGNYYHTAGVRLGSRFALAVYQAAKEGSLLYRDAYRLTGLYGNTFDKYFSRLRLA